MIRRECPREAKTERGYIFYYEDGRVEGVTNKRKLEDDNRKDIMGRDVIGCDDSNRGPMGDMYTPVAQQNGARRGLRGVSRSPRTVE